MKDSEARGLILQKLYDARQSLSSTELGPYHFGNQLDEDDIHHLARGLYYMGLIEARILESGEVLKPRITSEGVEVVEGQRKPPFPIEFQGSDRNAQRIISTFESIVEQIERAEAPEDEKRSAREQLAELLKHPLLVKLFGELAGQIPGLG